MIIRRRKAKKLFAAPLCGVAKQHGCFAITHCNEHQANDSKNHSLPSLSFGNEINRISD